MRALPFVVALLGVLPALAQPEPRESDADARARAHFEVGRGLYKLGNYSEAIREFTAGYALVPKPGFLLNLAQAHRRLNHFAQAREFCERFLAEAPTTEPERGQVWTLLAEIQREQALTPRPPPEPPPMAPLAPPPGAELLAPSIPVAPSPPPKRTRRWVWPVVAVGTAAIAATLAGVLTVLLSHDYSAQARGVCTGGCVLLDGFH